MELLGAPINLQSYDGDPCIAPDGRWLVFYSARAGGFGGTDLYVSFSDGHGGWNRPLNLGEKFNSARDEYGAHLSSDGRYLFFTRHNTQGNGLFWVAASAIDKLATAEPVSARGPYLGQRPPGETPEPFAPDFLSARYGFVARIAFSPEGDECMFTVTDATFSHPKILATRLRGGVWSEPECPSFASPRWVNQEPFYSRDGNRITFTSNREASPATNTKDFWMVVRTATGWSEPSRLPPPINSDFTEYFYSEASDGTVYFCSNRPGGIGAVDLYRVRSAPGQPAIAEDLGPRVNSSSSTGDPCIASDGRFLVYSANRTEGHGGSDLYVSFPDGSGGWTAPINLGEGFNNEADEYAPSLSPDERYLFFTRHDGRRADLQWVRTSALERLRPHPRPPEK